MAQYVYGERIGKTAALRCGVSALIWDETRTKILLTQRTDNGRWCLPGGMVDAGETVEEACLREVLEETGLETQLVRLIGIYSTPHRITVYQDGNRVQYISLSFEVVITGGELQLSDETTAYGYFTLEDIHGLDLIEPHHERIQDALLDQITPFLK